jgi:hypothetical protein
MIFPSYDTVVLVLKVNAVKSECNDPKIYADVDSGRSSEAHLHNTNG